MNTEEAHESEESTQFYTILKSIACKFPDPLEGLSIKMHIHHSLKTSYLDHLLSRFPLHPMGEKETSGFCIVFYLKAYTHSSSLNHCLSEDRRSKAMSLEKNMLANHNTPAGTWFSNWVNPACPYNLPGGNRRVQVLRLAVHTDRCRMVCTQRARRVTSNKMKGWQKPHT